MRDATASPGAYQGEVRLRGARSDMDIHKDRRHDSARPHQGVGEETS